LTLSRKRLLARIDICIVIPLINALAIDRGVELALVSGLAALGTVKAGSATLLPLADARPEIGQFLALRVPLVDLLALVFKDTASGSSPAAATALTVLPGAWGVSIDDSCSGQHGGHGDVSETIFILVALVVGVWCGGNRGRGCRRSDAEMLTRGSCS
jgi:hypothetical protein